MSVTPGLELLKQVCLALAPLEEALLITDTNGRIVAAAPSCEAVFGWRPADLVGQPWTVLHQDPFPPGYLSHESSGHPPVAVRFKRRDGSAFRGQLRDAQVQLTAAAFRGFVLAVRDLSEQMMVEQKLSDARQGQALGTLVRKMSHRINNGLGNVIAYIELARQRTADAAILEPLGAALEKITGCREALTGTLREVPGYQETSHASDIFRRPEGMNSAPPRRAKILVVEDEGRIREMVTHQLERDGHQVEFAETGQSAMLSVVSGSYDVILTDSVMPGKPAPEFVRLLRAAQPNARVAVMSGQLYSAEERSRLREVGAHAFLAKPFQVEELRRVVSSLL